MKNIFDDLYIFEMANNHQGSIEHGIRIIEEAARLARTHKIKAAVKLQFRELDSFIHSAAKGKEDIKHIPRFESTKLSKDQFRQLANTIKENGLITVATPFDEASVDTCLDLGIQIIKVASCSAGDWPLLTEIAKAKKPVICSTGGLSIYDIDNVVSYFRKRVPLFALMHCVSLYPTPNEQMVLNFMSKMMRRYPYVTVGYSGHEAPDNTDVAIAAISKGARLLERHFGVPTSTITLNKYSMNPEEGAAWIQAAQRALAICGDEDTKHVSQEEKDSLLSLQRGVFARQPILKGQVIEPEDVYFAMPCQGNQLTSGEFGHLRLKITASKDYQVDEGIYEKAQDDDMTQLRGILHDAKGQIFEAGIELGEDYSIEISHHFGLDKFRSTGCIIVNLINREYCKKILIQLPGQKHPLHRHRLKEETFHVLWGELEVDLNGNTIHLKAGDKLLVERGAVHGFTTTNGAIFEEVSTTHVAGDSYYEDPVIAQLDPIQRKTILESW